MTTLEDKQHPPIPITNNSTSSSSSSLTTKRLKTTLVFTISHTPGALEETLCAIKALQISLTRIESRPTTTRGSKGQKAYDLFVDFVAESEEQVHTLIEELKKKEGTVLSVRSSSNHVSRYNVPWFPRKKKDLDTFADHILAFGAQLDADHPGFTDEVYRKRRHEISDMAMKHRHGMDLPHVAYTPIENATWTTVWDKLQPLWALHACAAHKYAMPLLMSNCGYSRDRVPQIQDASRFLQECTGFTLRPVMGLLSPRDFLNGLAFRVFHSTQYIRHASKPLFTPEPDVCHELFGHVPLFADPDFAAFSQEVGLASLGVSDEDIKKLSSIYWFTVEYGLCKDEGGEIKAYGAGHLGGAQELEYAFSGKPEFLPFDPFVAAVTEYPITDLQPRYFVAESFRDAQSKIREYAQSLKRPFSVRYNPYTERIEVLDTKDKILRIARAVKGEMHTLVDALEKLSV